MTPPAAIDTTGQDLFVLLGLAAALALIWLALDGDFQAWRQRRHDERQR